MDEGNDSICSFPTATDVLAEILAPAAGSASSAGSGRPSSTSAR